MRTGKGNSGSINQGFFFSSLRIRDLHECNNKHLCQRLMLDGSDWRHVVAKLCFSCDQPGHQLSPQFPHYAAVKQEEMTDIISLWSNTVDPYINTTDAICTGRKIIECAEIRNYFEAFPLFRAAGQIGLIKEGKTGSFKVASIINWLPQPKGLPGQGRTRKQLCCWTEPLGSYYSQTVGIL